MLVTRSKYRQRTGEQVMPGKSISFLPESLKGLVTREMTYSVESHVFIEQNINLSIN